MFSCFSDPHFILPFFLLSLPSFTSPKSRRLSLPLPIVPDFRRWSPASISPSPAPPPISPLPSSPRSSASALPLAIVSAVASRHSRSNPLSASCMPPLPSAPPNPSLIHHSHFSLSLIRDASRRILPPDELSPSGCGKRAEAGRTKQKWGEGGNGFGTKRWKFADSSESEEHAEAGGTKRLKEEQEEWVWKMNEETEGGVGSRGDCVWNEETEGGGGRVA